MTCCPFCKRTLVATAIVGAIACAEHGIIFSNVQDGREPRSVTQAVVARPVPSITSTSGSVPRFVSNQFFFEEPNPSHIWASIQATRNSSFLLVVNGAHRNVMAEHTSATANA